MILNHRIGIERETTFYILNTLRLMALTENKDNMAIKSLLVFNMNDIIQTP